MSLFIDQKYISLLGPKLERFQRKNDNLWNFRCPACGDSKKNKLKARGYIYRKKSNLSFICHNCHASMSFGNFLKSMDKLLYKEYQLERYKEESSGNVKQPDFSLAKEKPVFNNKINLPTIESLPETHVAKKYVLDRQIPLHHWKNLYYADDFKAFIEELLPHNKLKLIDNDRRLVLPFYTEKNILAGVQGRSLSNSKVRYITLKVSDDSKKIFGLNKVDFTKPIYVVEGPIDSLFLENSIATMDSALYSVLRTLGDYNYVFVYDNESRNKEIIKHMQTTISLDKKICIWPSNIKAKDINDIVLSQLNPQEIINRNIYSGLKAQLALQMWKRV